MRKHPFPVEGLPADPKLESASRRLVRRVLRLEAKKFRYGAKIRIQAEDGGWVLRESLDLRHDFEEELSAHERLEAATTVHDIETALLELAAALDPAACSRIGMRIDLTASEFQSDPRLSVHASTWRDLNGHRLSVSSLAKTLPVAAEFLRAVGPEGFLPPSEKDEDVLMACMRERTRDPTSIYDAFSVKIESGQVGLEAAGRNALLQTAFLGALRDGIADPSDFGIERIEWRSAVPWALDEKVRREAAEPLISAKMLESPNRRTRQKLFDAMK